MILTITLNPLLERRYYYSNINLDSVNRNGTLNLKAGGKGININRQLNKLGIRNIALTFIGGNNGKLMRESLHNEKIFFTDIITKNETRDVAVIIDQSKNKVYYFFRVDSEISDKEVDDFILKMEKMIATCEVVAFSGSSPCKSTDIIFPEGINIANKLGKISLCDTYGEHFQNCLDASPTIIHNNVNEIHSSLGLSLNNKKEYIALLNKLYKSGIKQAYITNAARSFYASNFDFHYKITLPKIDTVDSTGSGDSFAAGIIQGWHNKSTFKQQLQFASALGICNARSLEVCDVSAEDAIAIVEQIKISSVGKKIKEINDDPQ